MTLTRITSDGITDAAIVNADINASAAIAGTKINPSFGNQNVVTSGNLIVNSGQVTINGSTAAINFTDNEDNPDYRLVNSNGIFKIRDATNTVDRLKVNTDGHVDITGNLDVGAGIDVTGNVDLSSAESNASNTAQFKLSNLSIGQHNNIGSYRFANAGTGSFLFSADAINFFNKDVNKNFLRLSASSVELYHDNVKKAETSSTGFDIPEDFIAGSGSKLTVGASGDLTFFHDSANSYVQNNTGDLILGDTNHQYFRGNTSDKSVSLYFNGSEKQKTTSSGVSVTGSISVSGTVDGRDVATDGSKLDGIAAGATNVTNTNQLTNGAGFLTSVGTSNISDDAVTFAKMQHIGSPSFLGRNSSGTGAIENLSVSDVRTMLNVENGATADQSASEILTLIKTVDGSGSGLDADTLDGVSSASFLRSDASDTCTGAMTFNADCSFSGGGGAVSIVANSDISFASGNWTGNHTKIQHHSNYLYIVGGSNGIVFRESGTNRAFITGSGHFEPGANNTYDLGGSSARWRNVYTSDLVLSNEGSKNDVDATWGSYTIQEGHHDLFLINKRTGKKYKFNLTEVN